MNVRNYFRQVTEKKPTEHLDIWVLRVFLEIVSWIYGIGVFLHRSLYRTGVLKAKKFKEPVVSVGNLTWGGTGKTPLVTYLANFFIHKNKTPLILARGYGADESKELEANLNKAKLGIGANRVKRAELLLNQGPADVVILDDGFQHWKIKRDLDIVLVNVLNPFGNGSLIPRGNLRERFSAFKRASFVILTDADLISRREVEAIREKIRSVNPSISFALAGREPVYFYRAKNGHRFYPDFLEGKRVSVFTGIETPRSFLMMLNRMGVKAAYNFEFSDHHRFHKSELEEILRIKNIHEVPEVVTTEKDFFRCRELITKILNPLVLKARFRFIEGEHLLQERLSALIGIQNPAPVQETPSPSGEIHV